MDSDYGAAVGRLQLIHNMNFKQLTSNIVPAFSSCFSVFKFRILLFTSFTFDITIPIYFQTLSVFLRAMRVCEVFGCENRMGGKTKPGLSFHRFPRNNYQKKLWERAVGGENWTAPPLALLCSLHFEESDFDRSGKLARLNKGVVPSIFNRSGWNEYLDQLSSTLDSIDIDENSNSNLGTNEGSIAESSVNNECSRDSLSDCETPMTEKIAHAMKQLTQNSNMKFMENFDPETSNRERRKLSRKIYTGGKKQAAVYDDKGILISTGSDICDCMNIHCPGCHFPCSRCQSQKCGHECRVNRKWTYEFIEIDGSDIVIKPSEHVLRKTS